VEYVDEEDGTVGLEISEGVVVRVARAAVAKVISAPEVAEEDDAAEADDEVDHQTDANVNPVIEQRKD
jgi:hypothetical protein